MSPLLSGLASVASLVFNAASSGAVKSAAPRRGSEEAQAQPSAVVTLSPQAEALAGFAGKGILVSQGKVDSALGGVADGIQFAVFDVRNAAQGKRLATQTVGGRGSITTLDSTRPVLNLQAVDGKVRLAFPARVYQAPTGVGTPPPVRGYQGALRLEVNTTTGALASTRSPSRACH